MNRRQRRESARKGEKQKSRVGILLIALSFVASFWVLFVFVTSEGRVSYGSRYGDAMCNTLLKEARARGYASIHELYKNDRKAFNNITEAP